MSLFKKYEYNYLKLFRMSISGSITDRGHESPKRPYY